MTSESGPGLLPLKCSPASRQFAPHALRPPRLPNSVKTSLSAQYLMNHMVHMVCVRPVRLKLAHHRDMTRPGTLGSSSAAAAAFCHATNFRHMLR